MQRNQVLFLLKFFAILVAAYLLIAWNPVNDHVIVPFTEGVARVSGAVLNLMGQHVTTNGTQRGMRTSDRPGSMLDADRRITRSAGSAVHSWTIGASSSRAVAWAMRRSTSSTTRDSVTSCSRSVSSRRWIRASASSTAA